jgi:hypothetical protein
MLIALPTGTGKTVVFALLLQHRGGRSLTWPTAMNSCSKPSTSSGWWMIACKCRLLLAWHGKQTAGSVESYAVAFQEGSGWTIAPHRFKLIRGDMTGRSAAGKCGRRGA